MLREMLDIRFIPGKGRGVVALRDYSKGEVIEIAPVIFTFDGFEKMKSPELAEYELAWGKKVAIAGGLTHLYNHSDKPNIVFEREIENWRIVVRAKKAIKAGDELCHKYFCKPWFNVA